MNKIFNKISNFIVNCRYFFLSLFIILIPICCININNVKINYNLIEYLPNNNEIVKTNKLMLQEFGSISEIQLLIKNISYEEVLNKVQLISEINLVKNIIFNKNDNFYKDNDALIIIELENISDIEINNFKEDINKIIGSYDYHLYTKNDDISVNNFFKVFIIMIAIMFLLLLILSNSYFDLFLSGILFSTAFLINMGSNFLIGELSYICNYVAIILQLGLFLKYYLIVVNNYNKEIDDTSNKILAIKRTMSKSLPFILISGLSIIIISIPLFFMNLKIGKELFFIITKSVLCSVLITILLLPCLLVIFNKIILKLRHRKISISNIKISKIIISKGKILLLLFLFFIFVSIILMTKYNYIYNNVSINNNKNDENTISLDAINNTFGENNLLIVLVKNSNKDYSKELKIAEKISNDKKIISVTNLGNIKLDDNLYLGSSMNYQDFSLKYGMDIQKSLEIYQMYENSNNDMLKVENIDNYYITIIDLFNFLYLKQDEFLLDDNIKTIIEDYNSKIKKYINYLESDNYSRFLIEYRSDLEDSKTFKLMDMIKEDILMHYSEVEMIGDNINSIELKKIFNKDNVIINIITIIILIILLFLIYKSIGMTILLSLLIESSYLIAFGILTIFHYKFYILVYIIAKFIQIGFLTSYVIFLSNKYQLLRKKMDKNRAIFNVLNDKLSLIVIGYLLLIIISFVISYFIKVEIISSLGFVLVIGFIVSMIITITILPIILNKYDKFIQITTIKN